MQVQRKSEDKRHGRLIKKARTSNIGEDDSFSDQENPKISSATKLIDDEETDTENSSETDDSEQIDEETLLKLEKDLMVEYWEVRKKFEKSARTFGQNIFLKNIDGKIEPREFTPNAFDLEECSHQTTNSETVESSEQRNYGSVHVKSKTMSSHGQNCLLFPLEAIDALPPMQYWTLTEVNVLADDEYTLSHIPFFGDHVDDTKFCRELLEAFPDGIHGVDNGCGEFMNDFLLYYTIKAIKAKCPSISESTVFKCIHQNFPNKSSTNELESLFLDLQQRFEPESIEKQELTNESGEFVANSSSSKLLNSYETLLCHKCFSFDCLIHEATVENTFSGALRSKRRQSFFKSAPKHIQLGQGAPCSITCYKHKLLEVGQKQSKASQKQRQLSIGVADNCQKTPSWTPHEESMVNLLRSTQENDFCKIAFCLNKCSRNAKTCAEVYEYSLRNAPHSPKLNIRQSPKKSKKSRQGNHRSFRAPKWAQTNGKVENKRRFVPCKHEGSCEEEAPDCDCLICTKYCACAEDCANRFPGCRCNPGNCNTKSCLCYLLGWECDPDICLHCNCDKLDINSKEPVCKNISIQRGLQKQLIVAPSQLAGWGCFAGEDIGKNDFISEYCGEVITQEECERRGKIYDKIKCSYLFGLNDEQVVDATRIGNWVKDCCANYHPEFQCILVYQKQTCSGFWNHSCQRATTFCPPIVRFAANHSINPNCEAKVIVVNGDHKIGIFARRHIKAGEELFFNYDYSKNQQVEFVQKN